MLMPTRPMGVPMGYFFGRCWPHIQDLNIEGQSLARQRVVGVYVGAVPSHL
jgi:hypothetical protein